jgi:hypothetical protein
VKSIQPSKDEITSYGIKVRDFAYESTLPPIRPYIRKQIMPMPDNMEKRENDDTDDESDNRPHKKSRLERELTEPSFPTTSKVTPATAAPVNKTAILGRSRALADLSQFGAPHGGFTRSITSSPPLRTIVDNDGGIVPTPISKPIEQHHFHDLSDQSTISFSQPSLPSYPSVSPGHRVTSSEPRNTPIAPSPVKSASPVASRSLLRSLSSSPLHQPTSTPRYFLRSRTSRSNSSRPNVINARKTAMAATSRVRKTTSSKRR